MYSGTDQAPGFSPISSCRSVAKIENCGRCTELLVGSRFAPTARVSVRVPVTVGSNRPSMADFLRPAHIRDRVPPLVGSVLLSARRGRFRPRTNVFSRRFSISQRFPGELVGAVNCDAKWF